MPAPDGAGPAEAPAADRFRRAVAAIDAANADDPHRIVVDGVERPKELAHAELATAWVRRLDPDADEVALLAARAHHLRRWSLPRSSYPEGRSGYLRWRTELKRRHADEVATVLEASGYDSVEIARVQQIIRKEGLGRDAAVQTHEDALCLVFLQTQFDDVIGKLGHDKAVDVVRKTIRKMSPAALDLVGGLDLSDAGRAVLAAATASGDAG